LQDAKSGISTLCHLQDDQVASVQTGDLIEVSGTLHSDVLIVESTRHLSRDEQLYDFSSCVTKREVLDSFARQLPRGLEHIKGACLFL
jgi:hypothetical protein